MRDLERKYVPVKKGGGSKKAVWMTFRAKRAVINKRKVFARHKDSDHPSCREANKKAAREIRSAKLNYEKKLVENVKFDAKSFYAYVRSKSKSRAGIGVLSRDDGGRVESPEKVAEEFNVYFSSVFSMEDLGSVPEVGGGPGDGDLFDMIVSREKVRDLLRKLRADKAPGVDELSPRLLLHFPEEILDPVCMLFEKSLREGRVPEDWRRANIVPIYKAGDRGKAKNYRPVSLTCQLCKVFEKLVRDELVEHLEANGLLRGTQHGFRKGRSCLTKLLSFLDRVMEELDNGGSVDDFAKAFDKVPHQRLLRKLERYGVSGRMLAWIRGWLLKRWQRVGVRRCWSRWRKVLSGIPQGSVLGPVLFLVFIDNLEEGLMSEVLKFADDTKIFRRVDSEEDREMLQRDLDRLVQWSEVWQMKFNVDKCKVMHLGRGNSGGNYMMNGGRLGMVGEERDLGVRITNDLKTSAHCAYVCTKANRVLGMISRTVMYKNPNILTRLYKSLVRPQLEYGVSAWLPHYVKDRERLERVQHRFTRMVPGLKGLKYGERLERLNLMSLEKRRNRSDLVELFKISKGLFAIPWNSFFRADRSERTRGHTKKLAKECFRLDIRKHFFSQRVVNRWNALSEEVVSAGTVGAFKRRLDE